MNSTRLGPVGDPYTVSPSGSGRCSFQNNAATIYTIASTGAMLLYRAETRQRRNAALAAEPRCASDFNSHQAACHSVPHFAHTVSESYNHPDGVGLAPFSRACWLVSTTNFTRATGADIVMESIAQGTVRNFRFGVNSGVELQRGTGAVAAQETESPVTAQKNKRSKCRLTCTSVNDISLRDIVRNGPANAVKDQQRT